MSKYTEAIEFLEHLEGKDLEFSWTDSGITELLKARDLAVETLEIADRLEQADVTKHKKDYRNIEDSEWDSGYQIGYINGYNQALADIRGDTE